MRRFHYDSTTSTNERALEALAAGDGRHLDLYVADHQSAGRGRRGRVWFAGPPGGLFLSLIWRPPKMIGGAAMSVAAGLGVLAAVRELGLPRAHLKWPNDLLVGEAKLAGILIETRGLDPSRPAYVVGVGLNVAQRTFPAELERERAVTSLALQGVQVDPPAAEERLVPALIHTLSRLTDQSAALAREYLAAAGLSGPVRARTAEGWIEGELFDLDLGRGIQIATPTGIRRIPLERLRALQRREP